MKRLISITVAMAFIFCLYVPVQADKIDRRTEEATNIVSGKIKQIKSYYATNRWGDDLIMSEVTLKVDKTLKGEQRDQITFVVEGGEVGDTILRVSSVPLFVEGETVVLYLKKRDSHFEYLDSKQSDVSAPKAKTSPQLPCCKTFAKWTSTTNVPFKINPNTLDMQEPCPTDEISKGAYNWNGISSRINLYYDGLTSTNTVSSKDQNIVFFRNDPSGSTIAVTYIWYTKRSGITAFDMVFYDSWDFFGLLNGCNSTTCNGGFYLQTIAAHEFGHAIGLDHNRCESSLMYPYASWCENNGLSTADTACVQNLYPINN